MEVTQCTSKSPHNESRVVRATRLPFIFNYSPHTRKSPALAQNAKGAGPPALDLLAFHRFSIRRTLRWYPDVEVRVRGLLND